MIADDAVGAEHIEQLDADLSFADNAKAKFGGDDDLEIYSDNSNCIIAAAGDGDLQITSVDDIVIKSADNIVLQPQNGEDGVLIVGDDAVKLYYDGGTDPSFETTANGAKVTGTLGVTEDVGIGDTSPESILDVEKENSTTYPFTTEQSGTYAYSPYDHEINIKNLKKGTTNSFTGIYFHAGEHATDGKSSTARISAVNTGDYKADLVFGTRNTNFGERLRIKADGDVGIGEDSPDSRLHVKASDTAICTLENTNADANGVKLDLYKHSSSPADDDYLGEIRFIGENDASESILYSAIEGVSKDVSDGTEDGEIIFKTRDSGEIITAGRWRNTGGICFNSDTALANCLDDYEEGTFTPNWIGSTSTTSVTYTSSINNASYTKIGDVVTCRGYSNIDTMDATGSIQMNNLPFTSKSGNDALSAGSCIVNSLSLPSGTSVVPYKNGGSTQLQLFDIGDDTAWGNVQVQNSWAIIWEITYPCT